MDIERIKVSLVVAIYKVEPYLDKLIKSILNQTHHNIEVILVDDGSPDGCGRICDKYAAIDSRIVVLHKKNGGGCDARNKGMELMSGDWLTIIDGDDWLEPNFIEYLLGIAISLGAEMAMTDRVFTSTDRVQNEDDQIEKWSGEKAASEIIALKFPMGCWNKLYNVEMIRKNNLYFSVPWFGEGMYFCTMAAQYSNFVAVGHRKVYNYRTDNAESSTTKYNVQNGINGLWNIKNIYNVSVIRTSSFLHIVEWHIWFNYNFLLRQIVGTNSQRKYWKEYFRCRIMLILMLPRVLFHGVRSNSQKIYMIKLAFFPRRYAKKMIKEGKN